MNRLGSILVVMATLAFAQKTEVGGVAGFGNVAVQDEGSSGALAFGAEFCGVCSGGYAVFAEYSHLESVGNFAIKRFDIVAGGLRIQGGRRVRPFFDIGIAYGVDRFEGYSYDGKLNSHGNVGVVLAGGAAIRLKDRLYVRPQFRLYALRQIHVVAVGSAGVGIRF